jgi:uncharacterized membrane protein
MKRWLVGYGAALSTLLVLDALWLGVVARPLYQQGLGPLLADPPRWGFAAAFYLLYPLGVVIFAVLPMGATVAWPRTLLLAALFGLFCYGTYDLTNLATLKGWPVRLAVLDMAWGAVLSVAVAAAAKALVDRLSPG